MKLNPKIAGVIILLPIVALEAIIKGLLFLLYYPAEVIAIIFYPCFKRTNIDKIFNSCSSLVSVSLLNTKKIDNMSNLFNRCRNLTTLSRLDTSLVTNMYQTFCNCNSLIKVDITRFNLSNISSVNGSSLISISV